MTKVCGWVVRQRLLAESPSTPAAAPWIFGTWHHHRQQPALLNFVPEASRIIMLVVSVSLFGCNKYLTRASIRLNVGGDKCPRYKRSFLGHSSGTRIMEKSELWPVAHLSLILKYC